MAASAHAFWPSFPTLVATLNTANVGLWRFGPIFMGVVMALENEYDSNRGPPRKLDRQWPYNFASPSDVGPAFNTKQCWFMGVLVQMILGGSGYKIKHKEFNIFLHDLSYFAVMCFPFL